MRLLALLASGCGVCGEFSYRGYAVDEKCGVIYGAQGTWFRDAGVVELRFDPSLPLTRPGLDWGVGEPTLMVLFSDEHLKKGTVVPPEELFSTCSYAWAGRPGEPAGAFNGPADVEVEVLGRGFNPDFDPNTRPRVQRFAWRFDCAEGEVVSEGTDVVELVIAGGGTSLPAASP
jgi:hypothetical protein